MTKLSLILAGFILFHPLAYAESQMFRGIEAEEKMIEQKDREAIRYNVYDARACRDCYTQEQYRRINNNRLSNEQFFLREHR